MKNLLKNIKSKKIKIGIIGLGYVGLPLLMSFANKKIKLIGFDTDISKINFLNNGKSYIDRISNKSIKEIKNYCHFTNKFSYISDCDVIIICVPTPLTKRSHPDLSYIKDTFLQINKFLRLNQVLILESTSYPGTTEEIFVKKLKSKFQIGKNFFIGFSSERINPGQNENKLYQIPKVISGYSKNCLRLLSSIYSLVFKKIVGAKDLKSAEFSKLLENIYRSVNIGFINEMKIVADNMGLDIFEIIEIANTKPYGFRKFNPGPGVGGHCIPIDPEYLYWKSSQLGYKPKFIKLSSEVNKNIINFIYKKIFNYLKTIKNYKKSKVLILGVAYKKNVDDIRESSSLNLLKLLKEKNIKNLYFSDPYIGEYISTRTLKTKIRNIKISKKNLKKFDLVILMTDHDKFNYKMIHKYSKKIIDCRGRFKKSFKVLRG